MGRMENEISAMQCAICRGALGRVLLSHEQRDRFEIHVGVDETGYHREWVECSRCGSATNLQSPENQRKLASLAAEYYEVDLANSSIAEKYDRVMNLPPDRSDNAGRVERIRSTVEGFHARIDGLRERRRRALDIGAGTGVFLSRFVDSTKSAAAQWTAVGIEPDPRAANHLRSIGKFEVHAGRYDGQREFRDFDLVTLNKVVEHIPAPVSFVKQAAQALSAKCGIIYIEVPDRLTIGRRPPSDNILGSLHHHLYTPQGLMTLFQLAGLVALNIGRVFEPSGKITVYGFAAREDCMDALSGDRP